MIVRWTVLIGLVLVSLPLILGCPLFGSDGCKDAQQHYCSKLPGFDCDDSTMDKARNSVIKECGSEKARAFFQRAIGRCGVSGRNMSCPTD